MKHIDEGRIADLREQGRRASRADILAILEKSRALKRLTIAETAALLAVEDADLRERLFETARWVKDAIYGKRVVLFAPLYVSNFCVNQCLYCGFRNDNDDLPRKALSMEEVAEQTRWLLKRGHMRALLVAGESAPPGMRPIDYLTQCIETIYATQVGPFRIKRINVNCAPLSVDDFKKLKAAGIGTYQLFQETYHDATYRAVHVRGPKSDPDRRLDAINQAFEAGLDDYGVGVLYGLYDYQFETLAMMQHIEYLETTLGVGPHTISMPRIEPAQGVAYADNPPAPVSDDDFRKIVAVLRLAVPYTGLILSTRETPTLRDQLLDLGISQISAESATAPGGYGDDEAPELTRRTQALVALLSGEAPTADPLPVSAVAAASPPPNGAGGQFMTSDQRTLDEVVLALMEKDYTPSFCAACYRKGRTGEVFMHLAQPGAIKMQCGVNSLATLQEYLLDFASDEVKTAGKAFIERAMTQIDEPSRRKVEQLFARIAAGERDVYV
ncbi:MAG: [FeFe] hydrogenase H-cluster radical SAM maturase HydG [Vampirovibrionales bacterium]|nr:[FeFe] hydrogenase H-cluster radical SAM maturase HydG [Vampirovibrionales bacterium]